MTLPSEKLGWNFTISLKTLFSVHLCCVGINFLFTDDSLKVLDKTVSFSKIMLSLIPPLDINTLSGSIYSRTMSSEMMSLVL